MEAACPPRPGQPGLSRTCVEAVRGAPAPIPATATGGIPWWTAGDLGDITDNY